MYLQILEYKKICNILNFHSLIGCLLYANDIQDLHGLNTTDNNKTATDLNNTHTYHNFIIENKSKIIFFALALLTEKKSIDIYLKRTTYTIIHETSSQIPQRNY
jgi:hypothetical protein